MQRSRRRVPPIRPGLELRVVSEPGFGAKEPPPGTPDQAGLRINSFVRRKVVSEPGFGAKQPPLGTPDQVRLDSGSVWLGSAWLGSAWIRSARGLGLAIFASSIFVVSQTWKNVFLSSK